MEGLGFEGESFAGSNDSYIDLCTTLRQAFIT